MRSNRPFQPKLRPNRVAICALAGTLAVSLLACDAPAPRQSDQPVRLSLAALLADADVDSTVERIRPGAVSTAGLLSTGWHPMVADQPMRWTSSPSALIEVPIAGPADDLRLRIKLMSSNTPTVSARKIVPQMQEPQRVALLWNGALLGTPELATRMHVVEVEIPVALQHVGRNQLELRPSYWLPSTASVGLGGAPVGVGLVWLKILQQPVVAIASAPAAVARSGDIRQKPGSVLTYSLVLPDRPVLKARAHLRQQTAGPSKRSGLSIEVRLVDTEARSVTLLDYEPPADGDLAPIEVDADLSRWSGQMVQIQIAFAARRRPSAATNWTLRWEDPHIAGFEARGEDRPVAQTGDPKNVLVLVMDALRADATEPYGALRGSTPAIARLAAEGAVFENARSNASWTRTSIASLFTSLEPDAHGVTGWTSSLSRGLPYLPELLRERGYRTYGLTRNMMVYAGFGLDRGFDAFDYERPENGLDPEVLANRTFEERLLPFIRAEADAPFFIYLHDLDPHSPYVPPVGYEADQGRPYAGQISGGGPVVAMARATPEIFSPGDRRQLRALYDGEVRAMDAYLGVLLAHLDDAGLRDNTLVVLLSDHGEEFFDHGKYGHGHTVYDELLRVPLIMRLPGVLSRGHRISEVVPLRDLPRTVLDLLGLDIPPELAGQSLAPLLSGTAAPEDTVSVAGSEDAGLRSLVRASPGARFKLVQQEGTGENGPDFAQYMLFDLLEDPAETYNLFATRPAVGSVLRQLMRSRRREAALWESKRGDSPETILSQETLDQMRALGYVE